ncbi:DUF6526 family protein [Terriglobus sp. RCC_193]|uniref:DUF6526 family protein n=1 Tax=Terriglobus sp. RCC_193 TaxID=3239218 RepID=UPI003524C3FB
MMPAPQNYQNHGRFDPKFHLFTVPLILLCFIASLFHLWKEHTPANVYFTPTRKRKGTLYGVPF